MAMVYIIRVRLGMAACSNDLKVTSVEPPQGTFGGGEDVVIHGNGFQPGRGGVTVTFGKRPATSVVVASADKINVMTPGGDPNTTVDVTVPWISQNSYAEPIFGGRVTRLHWLAFNAKSCTVTVNVQGVVLFTRQLPVNVAVLSTIRSVSMPRLWTFTRLA